MASNTLRIAAAHGNELGAGRAAVSDDTDDTFEEKAAAVVNRQAALNAIQSSAAVADELTMEQLRGFFMCPVCLRGHADMEALLAHYQSDHGGDGTDDDSNDKQATAAGDEVPTGGGSHRGAEGKEESLGAQDEKTEAAPAKRRRLGMPSPNWAKTLRRMPSGSGSGGGGFARLRGLDKRMADWLLKGHGGGRGEAAAADNMQVLGDTDGSSSPAVADSGDGDPTLLRPNEAENGAPSPAPPSSNDNMALAMASIATPPKMSSEEEARPVADDEPPPPPPPLSSPYFSVTFYSAKLGLQFVAEDGRVVLRAMRGFNSSNCIDPLLVDSQEEEGGGADAAGDGEREGEGDNTAAASSVNFAVDEGGEHDDDDGDIGPSPFRRQISWGGSSSCPLPAEHERDRWDLEDAAAATGSLSSDQLTELETASVWSHAVTARTDVSTTYSGARSRSRTQAHKVVVESEALFGRGKKKVVSWKIATLPLSTSGGVGSDDDSDDDDEDEVAAALPLPPSSTALPALQLGGTELPSAPVLDRAARQLEMLLHRAPSGRTMMAATATRFTGGSVATRSVINDVITPSDAAGEDSPVEDGDGGGNKDWEKPVTQDELTDMWLWHLRSILCSKFSKELASYHRKHAPSITRKRQRRRQREPELKRHEGGHRRRNNSKAGAGSLSDSEEGSDVSDGGEDDGEGLLSSDDTAGKTLYLADFQILYRDEDAGDFVELCVPLSELSDCSDDEEETSVLTAAPQYFAYGSDACAWRWRCDPDALEEFLRQSPKRLRIEPQIAAMRIPAPPPPSPPPGNDPDKRDSDCASVSSAGAAVDGDERRGGESRRQDDEPSRCDEGWKGEPLSDGEAAALLTLGSSLVAVNGMQVQGLPFTDVIILLTKSPRPLELQFLSPKAEYALSSPPPHDAISSVGGMRVVNLRNQLAFSSVIGKLNHPSSRAAAEVRRGIDKFVNQFFSCDLSEHLCPPPSILDLAANSYSGPGGGGGGGENGGEEKHAPNAMVWSLLHWAEQGLKDGGLFDNSTHVGGGLPDMGESQWQDVRDHLERHIMARLFERAFCPLPALAHEDVVFADCAAFLGSLPFRPELLEISCDRGGSAAWDAGMSELSKMSSCSSPLDMLVCVVAGVKFVAAALSASTRGRVCGGSIDERRRRRSREGILTKSVAGDDILPGLVVALVRCSPPRICSSLQFMDHFCTGAPNHSNRMKGEAGYCLAQLQSAVSFVHSAATASDPQGVLTGVTLSEWRSARARHFLTIQCIAAAEAADLEALADLLGRGADPNGLNVDRTHTPLTAAVLSGQIAAIQAVLDAPRHRQLWLQKKNKRRAQRQGEQTAASSDGNGGEVFVAADDAGSGSSVHIDKAVLAGVWASGLLSTPTPRNHPDQRSRTRLPGQPLQGGRGKPQQRHLTALMVAAAFGFMDVVLLLLRVGADRHIRTLSQAAWERQQEGDEGDIARDLAARAGHVEIAVVLDADPSRISLTDAARDGNVAYMRALLKQPWHDGAAVDGLDASGSYTPLIAAVFCGHRAAVDFLLSVAGATVDAQNIAGETALMYSVGKRVEESNDDNDDEDDGMLDVFATAWRNAQAGASQCVIAARLLRNGADRYITDACGRSALEWAEHWGHPTLQQMLQADPAQVNILTAAQEGDLKTVSGLLSQGVDPNERDPVKGFTPLIAAVFKGDIALTQRLLARTPDMTSRWNLSSWDLSAAAPTTAPATATAPQTTNQPATAVVDRVTPNVHGATWGVTDNDGRPCSQGDDSADDDFHIPCDPNVLGPRGMTALMYAAQQGSRDLVALLLRKGANRGARCDALRHQRSGSEATTVMGRALPNADTVVPEQTALQMAESRAQRRGGNSGGGGEHAKCATLIRSDPDVVNICVAASEGDGETVQALLKQGVGVNGMVEVRSDRGIHHELSTPLIAAASHGQMPMLTWLLTVPDIDINLPNQLGETPLIYASANVNEPMVAILLRAGADRYRQDRKGQNAANWAENNHERGSGCARLCRTDPSIVLIHQVAAEGDCATLHALLAQGVPVNARLSMRKGGVALAGLSPGVDPEIDTPLMAAAASNRQPMVAVLLRHPAIAVNLAGPSAVGGRTALHLASARGYTDVVLLLLSAGADRYLPDASGSGAVYLARCGGHYALATLLETDPRRVSIHMAALRGDAAVVDALLRQNVDVNMPNGGLQQNDGGGEHAAMVSDPQNCYTPLIAAAHGKHAGVTRLLLGFRGGRTDGGANPDAANQRGETPLMHAAARGSMEIVKMLIDGGANRELRDGSGLTAANWASKGGIMNRLLFSSVLMVN